VNQNGYLARVRNTFMDREQLMALFLVFLMVGSVLAYGLSFL
jgi:hypothetical protein